MLDLIQDLFASLGEGAVNAHHFIEITHEGPPARYVMNYVCECGCGARNHTAMLMSDGETIKVNRTARLLVEPIERVVFRPIHVVLERWTTT